MRRRGNRRQPREGGDSPPSTTTTSSTSTTSASAVPVALAAFRLVFGLMMAYHSAFELPGFYHTMPTPGPDGEVALVRQPFAYRFTYEGFEWMDQVKPDVEAWLPVVQACAALGMALGVLFRGSTLCLWVLYAWHMLLDKSIFNNHDYLYLQTIAILFFSDAGKRGRLLDGGLWTDLVPAAIASLRRSVAWLGSVWAALLPGAPAAVDEGTRAGRKGRRLGEEHVCLHLLRAMFVLVHMFATFWKVDLDWVSGAAMQGTMEGDHLLQFSAMPWVRINRALPWLMPLMAVGGLLLDGTISVCASFPRTRWVAILGCLSFHSLNLLLFYARIGTFPLVMIASLTMFLPDEAEEPTAAAAPPPKAPVRPPRAKSRGPLIRWSWRRAAGALFLLVNLLVPLRTFVLYNSDVGWHRFGYRFSWTMMLHRKDAQYVVPAVQPDGCTPFNTYESLFDMALFHSNHTPVDVSALAFDKKHAPPLGIFPLPGRILTASQMGHLSIHPEDMVTFVRDVSDWIISNQFPDVKRSDLLAFAHVWNSYDSGPFQRLIHPRTNLLDVDPPGFSLPSFVLPRASTYRFGLGQLKTQRLAEGFEVVHQFVDTIGIAKADGVSPWARNPVLEVVRGVVAMDCQNNDGESIVLRPGDKFAYPPGVQCVLRPDGTVQEPAIWMQMFGNTTEQLPSCPAADPAAANQAADPGPKAPNTTAKAA